MGIKDKRKRTHGWPTRLPPISEVVDRYAESALVSAIRLRRYWMSQGDSPERATEKAVRQAVGMISSSGVPISRLIELFQEMKNAADAFIEMLERVREELRLNAEIEYLLELVSREPYSRGDYSERRRSLTLRLREILEEFGCKEVYDNLRTSRGFTPSDQLLRYSSRAFKRVLSGIIAAVKSYRSLNPTEEYQLKKKILLAVAEAKYGSERARRLEEEALRYAEQALSLVR
ncbi:MAG: hypothetical protein DRK00_11460 [Thermoprotei archaeon]|nr:MAG: hypothetical protein DRK00_11460 [Thermoprotei archaeon]